MLTREENRWNFTCLKFLSDWNFLPISVDTKSGRISRLGQGRLYKLYIWYFLFGLGLFHSLYGVIRFIQLVLSPNFNGMMDQFFVHSLIFPYLSINFWSHQLFLKRPRESVIIFNQLFNLQQNNPPPRKILTWDLKYNRHELITLGIPFGVTALCWFAVGFFLSDPNRMWILYSSLPAKYHHSSLFILLTTIDLFFFFRHCAITFFSFLNQLLFFQKCHVTFRSFLQNQNLRNAIELPQARSMEKLLKEMQAHFLYVHLFNQVYAYTIFTWKQIALVFAIFGGFFAIRYNSEYPFTAIFATYIHVYLMLVYSLMYEKAFTIPENWRQVKSQLRASAILSTIKQYDKAQGKAAQCQKEIKRIPELGVKVGGFHMMERVSTPNFIGFVISCVGNLLITSR